MQDRMARRLSWGATVLCVLYLVWSAYQLGRQVPVLAQLHAGLGGELPASTKFVIGASNFIHRFPGGFPILIFLVVGVMVGKELALRDDPVSRLAITLVIFLGASWIREFALSAMLEPLARILERIG